MSQMLSLLGEGLCGVVVPFGRLWADDQASGLGPQGKGTNPQDSPLVVGLRAHNVLGLTALDVIAGEIVGSNND